MKFQNAMVMVPAILLAGCASFEGIYAPSCAAYEGDRIALDGGEFVWDRFTDAIPVDDDGNPVDATPGYPLRGRYSGPDGRLDLETAAGEALDSLYLHREEGIYYLLTEEQNEQLGTTGRIPECALVRGGFDSGSQGTGR